MVMEMTGDKPLTSHQDVISYKLKSIDPIELEGGTTVPVTSKCGFIAVDDRFKKWLKQLLGATNFAMLDDTRSIRWTHARSAEGKVMRQVMKTFERLKRQFGQGANDMSFVLPEPLDHL